MALVAAGFDGQSGTIGVAVSGGSDSVALLHLMVAACPRDCVIAAVTVNHDLRSEAVGEARFVAGLCAELGVSHTEVLWTHGEITGNLPDAARRARYGLIGDWASARGIAVVMLGHTADDQAETVLMGLARAAGLDGLCGMRRWWSAGAVRFERPLLEVTRAALRAYLTRVGVAWVDDPTNDDTDYQRVKARRALEVLRPLGITAEGLGDVARNLAAARQALVAGVAEAAVRAVRDAAGALTLDRHAVLALPIEVNRRLLIASLRWVSGAEYAPRAASVMRVQTGIELQRDTTLWGCRVRVTEAEVRVVREPKAVAHLACPPDQLWDNRWRLEGPAEPGLEVRALGAAGLRACKDWRATGISRDALLVSPAIWRADALVAAPLAGLPNGWTARIDAGFRSFIISH